MKMADLIWWMIVLLCVMVGMQVCQGPGPQRPGYSKTETSTSIQEERHKYEAHTRERARVWNEKEKELAAKHGTTPMLVGE